MKISFDDVLTVALLKSDDGIDVYISNKYTDDQIISLKSDDKIKVMTENEFIEV